MQRGYNVGYGMGLSGPVLLRVLADKQQLARHVYTAERFHVPLIRNDEGAIEVSVPDVHIDFHVAQHGLARATKKRLG